MEEWVGQWWHQTLLRWTAPVDLTQAIELNDVRKSVGLLYRAAGGAPAARITQASAQRAGGPRTWLQRLAHTAQRAEMPQLESQLLALPASLSPFPRADLNRALYLWLPLLAAHYQHTGHWLRDNQNATQRALRAFPGFAASYHLLCQAQLSVRPALAQLSASQAEAESQVQGALRGLAPTLGGVTPQQVAPVWLWWVYHGQAQTQLQRDKPNAQSIVSQPNEPQPPQPRRRTRAAAQSEERNALVLPFRAEALMSWAELVRVNRSADDQDDGNAQRAANDMEQLSIQANGQSLASRVKFDLDLPSSSADDVPQGAGQTQPEWDYRLGTLLPDHCTVQELRLRNELPLVVPTALRRTTRQLRKRLEVLRDAPRAMLAQENGDDIDLDAWVREEADRLGPGALRDAPAIYTRSVPAQRSLSTLLLADLSQSTDAYANNQQRVIDVIREALYVFGEGLSAVGDPFAIWGFSSLKRHNVRVHQLKRFDQDWGQSVCQRLGAIRPGYYTRMGAALRHATAQMQQRGERRRLLMLLTDGKPNDLDEYEGRYGLEDTRHAVQEARRAGLTPFCVTIDATAHDYLPMLFGQRGFCLIHRPQELASRLTQVWSTLAA